MAPTAPERTPGQRTVDNAIYNNRRAAAGIAQVNVQVPIERIPELKAIALEWRRHAKSMLDSDLPSADQILQIHGVARALKLRLPVRAFATRMTAAEWLILHVALLPSRRAPKPRQSHAE